jgi:hypothetical protein
LAKETINLTDIMRVLGERPYPLKSSIKDYLEELKERQVKDESDELAAKEVKGD